MSNWLKTLLGSRVWKLLASIIGKAANTPENSTEKSIPTTTEDDVTYREAVEYILKHAAPYGLEHECLSDFVLSVETHRQKCCEDSTWRKPEFDLWANQALVEWDI